MQAYKQAFIEFMVQSQVLTFGDFTTKSGRKTPYFVNTGRYRTGAQLARLGEFYAAAATEGLGQDFDLLFGPAYKGIPLVTATAQVLAGQGRDVPFCFNRKEAKDHGEGGRLVGADVAGRSALLVDDVLTAGTAMREAVGLVQDAGGQIGGVIIALDRQEIVTLGQDGSAQNQATAVQTLAAELGGTPVLSILTLQDVMHYLEQPQTSAGLGPKTRSAMAEYQAQYCLL